MPILHHISAISHTCGSEAITFFGSMGNLEITLTVCHNLGLLRFSLSKIGMIYEFSVPTFQLGPFLNLDRF